MSRTPLMAGNWKMNLDHQAATLLVQKLDWTLKDANHDFGAVEVAVCPPFTGAWDGSRTSFSLSLHRTFSKWDAGSAMPCVIWPSSVPARSSPV